MLIIVGTIGSRSEVRISIVETMVKFSDFFGRHQIVELGRFG